MRSTPALIAALLLAGCASDPPPPGPSGPGAGGAAPRHDPAPGGQARARGPEACGRLFSSPHGEPFRATPGGPCPMRVWFDQADANHDGALSRAEFRDDAMRFFRTLDVNDDGVIGPGELQRYERFVFPEISFGDRPQAALDGGVLRIAYSGQIGGGAMGGQPGGGGGGGRGRHGGGGESDHDRGNYGNGGDPSSQGAGRYGLLDEPEPVAAADLNLDGRVSESEFATRADQRFDTLDKAQTGRLTYADLLSILPKGAGGRGRARQRPGS